MYFRTADGQLTDLTGARIDYKNPFDYKVSIYYICTDFSKLESFAPIQNKGKIKVSAVSALLN
jgi:hypothetical protein